MSDKLNPLSLKKLLSWILEEEKTGQIFGVTKALFFIPSENDPFRMERYGQLLETPIGAAAGPHTQMAQNIVTAWLLGARYIELKTVQTLDRLEIAKPCIDAEDEAYNCEWSQELRLTQSFDEYLKAWILIHILKHKFGWGKAGVPGFIFNMSVGYDLAGLLKPNMQAFLDAMQNSREKLEEQLETLEAVYPQIHEIPIPVRISNNVTLSTMHGCPPDEIEQMGRYLLKERKLHTAVKLNPTLLGPEKVHTLLNQKLGFKIAVPDEAFKHDLNYPDAVEICRSLQETAGKNGVHFGIKLTNTLISLNRQGVLPKGEQTVYMSGRALHPLAVHLAKTLQEEFGGALDISFSGGADAFNLSDLIAGGLRPVTVCTDLLKPGGYTRLPQYLENLAAEMRIVNAHSMAEFIRAKNGFRQSSVRKAALENLRRYAGRVVEDKPYKKDFYPRKSVKTPLELTLFDCIHAPCEETCAVHQKVPEYMYFTAKGDYRNAFEVILKTNPFPSVTGMACDHLCQTKCTRLNYDTPLLIREIKRFAAGHPEAEPELVPKPSNGIKTAVIGAGPSGLSCAYFLRLQGFDVAVYEAKKRPGGMLSDAIPAFRLPDQALDRDIARIENLGVSLHYETSVDKTLFKKLRAENNFIYLAIGAQQGKKLGIPGEDFAGVIDALSFLSDVRQKKAMAPGKRVAVIGGGNTAVDAARTAWRLMAEDGEVLVIYRRRREDMPADSDEVKEALYEGIRLLELTAPIEIQKKGERLLLRCVKMKPGKRDASGRPAPVPIQGSDFRLEFDTLIPAIGQNVVPDFLTSEDLQADAVTHETRIPGVYIGGDAMRGPSSLILAIADGKQAAETITKKAVPDNFEFEERKIDKGFSLSDFQKKSARRIFGAEMPEIPKNQRHSFAVVTRTLGEAEARAEADRCLYCDDICNVCVGVCPNRANLSVTITPVEYRLSKVIYKNRKPKIVPDKTFRADQKYQVLNIVDFCNECGNCTTFCPTRGAPYKNKPRFCLTETGFLQEDNVYRLGKKAGNPFIQFKRNGEIETLTLLKTGFLYKKDSIRVELNKTNFSILHLETNSGNLQELNLFQAAGMSVLLSVLKNSYLMDVAARAPGYK
ncbi:NAD-dependent dihydropyrimidine dehydrogenase subunit PreT [bacterium BMS3Bbin03]|nr:NAD-dependent dihydropyrimidine dehydrogenase subunit PreT [bacterium BMS3Bbin03]